MSNSKDGARSRADQHAVDEVCRILARILARLLTQKQAQKGAT